MPKSRPQTWLAVFLTVAGLLVIGAPSLWMFMRMTATRLHPNPQDVPSEMSEKPSQVTNATAIERSRQAVRDALTERNLPGFSVAVGLGGQLVWAEGFGFADLDQHAPMTPRHRFRIGTASVVLTSAALGLLLEEGRLHLDDPIQKYVPEFPAKGSSVTLRHLMAHTSGIRNDGGDEGPLLARTCTHPVEALSDFAAGDLLFAPGTKFKYSSYGWILLSAAVENAASGKKPFAAIMKERVFDPLGMHDTVPDGPPQANAAAAADRVSEYFPRFAADPLYGLHPMREVELSCYAGASAFVSTPSDLVRFGMAIHGGKLLKPATVQLFQTSQPLQAAAPGQNAGTGYGLGWDLETVQWSGKTAARVAGHDGDLLGGMVASLLTFPQDRRGLVVAVTSNMSYSNSFSLAVKIAEAFADSSTNQ